MIHALHQFTVQKTLRRRCRTEGFLLLLCLITAGLFMR